MNMLEYYIAEKIKLTEFTYIHIKRLHIYICIYTLYICVCIYIYNHEQKKQVVEYIQYDCINTKYRAI